MTTKGSLLKDSNEYYDTQDSNKCHVQGRHQATIMIKGLTHFSNFSPTQIGKYLFFFFRKLEEDKKCSVNSSSMSPIFTCLTNLKKEGFSPIWVLPYVDFTSPRKENSMVFSCFESLKIFDKEKSTVEFFKLVSMVRKSIK
jgi:hypothetical protein